MNNVVSRWIGLFVATVNVDSNKLVIGNYGNTGYYRVNYELATWQKIIQQLKTNHKVILHLQYLFNFSFHFALNLVSLWCSTSSKYRINVLSKHKKPQRFFDCINFVCIIAQFCKHVHCDSIPLNNEFGSFIFQPYSSLTMIINKNVWCPSMKVQINVICLQVFSDGDRAGFISDAFEFSRFVLLNK